MASQPRFRRPLSSELVVSDDAPPELSTLSGGDLTAGMAGDDFQIGRGCCAADGFVDLSGTAILRTATDQRASVTTIRVCSTLAQRSVISRPPIGASGIWPDRRCWSPGNGLLDIEGTFNARALFIGGQDGTGVVRVRGNGSITLTQQDDNPGFADIDMDFNHHPIFQPNQSGTIHMDGSSASIRLAICFPSMTRRRRSRTSSGFQPMPAACRRSL